MDIEKQIKSFMGTISDFKAKDTVSEQVADLFNVLLAETKKALPENPVVASIEPVGKSMMGTSMASAGELRTLAAQLLAAF
jgi:hypothetical protein